MSVSSSVQTVEAARLKRQSHHVLYLFYTLVFILYVVHPVSAVERNVTIDDQLGDQNTGELPRFTPNSEWATETCNGCAIVPEADQLFDKTVRQATFRPEMGFTLNSVDFTFNGTAIYIFFTLYNWEQNDLVTTSTECNFTIDGGNPTYFRYVGNPSLHNVRLYQSLVYQRTGLAHQLHHMNISVAGLNYSVFTSFDYAMYTMETQDINIPGTSSTSTSSIDATLLPTPSNPNDIDNSSDASPGVIAGSVVGGLVGLTGFALLLYFYFYRKGHKNRISSNDSTTIPKPFTAEYSQNFPSSSSADAAAAAARLGGQTLLPCSGKTNERPSRHTRRDPSVQQSMYSNAATLVTSDGQAQAYRNSVGSRDTVEHRIQAASRRMTKLREELDARNDSTSVSRETDMTAVSIGNLSSSATRELVGEVRRLRDEIQRLTRLQEVPPPMYTD